MSAAAAPTCPVCGARNPFNSPCESTMVPPMAKARKALEVLMLQADAVMNGEEGYDRQLLLEDVLARLAVIGAALVEADRAALHLPAGGDLR